MCDNLLFGAAAMLLAALPFSNALIELSSFVIIASFLVLWARRKIVTPLALRWLIAGWLAAALASALLSIDPVPSLSAFLRKTAQYALLCLAASSLGRDEDKASRILRIMAWTGILIGLDAVFQHFVGRDLLRLRFPHGERLTGPFNSPNNLASYLLLVIPVQVWWLFHLKRRSSKVTLILGVLIETFVLLHTHARIGLLILMFVLLVFALLTRRTVLLASLGILMGIGLWRWGGSDAILLLQLDPGRVEGWTIAWRMFLDHPVIGLGLGRYMAHYMEYLPSLWGSWPRPQYAHNCYLQLLAEGGLISLLAFLLLVGWVMMVTLKHVGIAPQAHRSVLVGLACALIAFLINIGFDTGLYSLPLATLFWFLFGLTAGRLEGEAAEVRPR